MIYSAREQGRDRSCAPGAQVGVAALAGSDATSQHLAASTLLLGSTPFALPVTRSTIRPRRQPRTLPVCLEEPETPHSGSGSHRLLHTGRCRPAMTTGIGGATILGLALGPVTL